MASKQTVMDQKAWLPTGTVSFSPTGIIAKLWNAVKIEIPVGYQDETGFHAGAKPAQKETTWPTTW